ncbi:Serine-enriched protein-like protein, partial [Dinothrombium tinctorium]
MGSRNVSSSSLPSVRHFDKFLADKATLGISRLLEDLESLLNDRESSDVLLIAGREEIPLYAHRESRGVERSALLRVLRKSMHSTVECELRSIDFYITCLQIILEDSNVFEVLAISYELGIDDLRQLCEEHIRNALCIHNSLLFLPLALELEKRIPEAKCGRYFKDRCTAYIGENALECIKTPAFLNLPKEALIHLVSSDCLALEEEDVWRAVLSWAKQNAGVTQPTAHWTEEERTRICQQLSGVINHVRILLIDSQVFAEEVEPTGAVPMEISLERYRFAALPNKFGHTEDRRVQPRTSLKLFQSSQILTGERLQYQRILNSWYGVSKQVWRLLFRASTHGYSSDSFHHHCDGHSPTYVLVCGTNGEVCGGFSDVPWSTPSSSRGKYVASEKAFIFTLINNSDVPPTKFEVVKKAFAIVNHPDYGPVFGAGADLSISSNCNTNMESYSNLPHSFD